VSPDPCGLGARLNYVMHTYPNSIDFDQTLLKAEKNLERRRWEGLKPSAKSIAIQHLQHFKITSYFIINPVRPNGWSLWV